VNGTSYDETISLDQRAIDDGMLPLKRPPHQNTLAEWMNDSAVTPVLMDMLAITAATYRTREYAAMIDESKMSQMRSAHARGVYYDGDIRDDAVWMACHALVGVETMIVMAVVFSMNRGKGTHETKFVEPLRTSSNSPRRTRRLSKRSTGSASRSSRYSRTLRTSRTASCGRAAAGTSRRATRTSPAPRGSTHLPMVSDFTVFFGNRRLAGTAP